MKDFLRKHFQGVTDGYITLWMKNKETQKSKTLWFNMNTETIWDELETAALDADATGWDCYFSTCPGGRADMSDINRLRGQDITDIPAFFMDVDTKQDATKKDKYVPDTQAAAAAALKAAFPPSYMVNSGNGVHAYWRFDKPIPANAATKKLLSTFAARIADAIKFKDIDVKASEPARILRLPGTHNHKSIPLQVSVIDDTGITYSLDSITAWMQQGMIPEGTRNDTLFRKGRSIRAKGADDAAVREQLSILNSTRCKPPLDADELNKIIVSVCTVEPGPSSGSGTIGKKPADIGQEINFNSFEMNLEPDRFGKPLKSIDNFLIIMKNDAYYDGLRFNELKGSPEKKTAHGYEEWRDADDAASMYHIESNYGLYSKEKHELALQNLLSLPERKIHPIKEYIQGIKWDGQNRIESFLPRWMKTEDTPYTREVSRLIFAGGINRLYEPGCKFDLIPILIGTNQGEGKSTIVRWLAMRDEFFGVINMFEGQASMEQLLGIWIGEVSELLALARAREIEAVKDFISRQTDYWRKPYERRPAVQKRACIMIGTTNHAKFLIDKTGNRRFLPVRVNSSSNDIFEYEYEIKEFIKQCWAEAKSRYDAGNMPPYENRSIIESIREAQEDAMEDDWRVGRVQAYLERFSTGTRVCIWELRHNALYPTDNNLKDDKKESRELGVLMDREPGWERMSKKQRPTNTKELGPQYCWEKIE